MKRVQIRAILSPSNPFRLELKTASVMILSNKINHSLALEVACAFALLREDLCISDLFLNISETVFHYLCDSPIQYAFHNVEHWES